MKKRIVCTALILSAMLSACSSGITQSEYDRVISEKEALLEKYTQAVSEKEAIQKKHDDLSESYEKFKTEYTDMLNEKTEKLVADLPNQFAQAWVDSAFSGKGICAVSDEMLFVSILTGKEANRENIIAMRSEFLSSVKTYSYMKLMNPDAFPWKQLSVTFYDASGAGAFQFTIDTDDKATLKSILLNAFNLDNLAKWIQ